MTLEEAARLLADTRIVLDRYRFWSDGQEMGNNEDVIELIERIDQALDESEHSDGSADG